MEKWQKIEFLNCPLFWIWVKADVPNKVAYDLMLAIVVKSGINSKGRQS